jgi:hypothetical protein
MAFRSLSSDESSVIKAESINLGQTLLNIRVCSSFVSWSETKTAKGGECVAARQYNAQAILAAKTPTTPKRKTPSSNRLTAATQVHHQRVADHAMPGRPGGRPFDQVAVPAGNLSFTLPYYAWTGIGSSPREQDFVFFWNELTCR